MTTPAKSPVLTALRVLAVITAVAAIAQTALGSVLSVNLAAGAIRASHAGTATIILVLTVVTAVVAILWSRKGGSKGLLYHAIGMVVLAVIQFALGEMGVEIVHIVIGVLFLVGSVALATLAIRKPVRA
ncbi:hypothetical protein [Granulicoccus phenolivorans]|uniref:hypothetical protein n=1 Tax=Granulicoccus phenolivorans TaxID=266854 RepID=UPI0011AE9096|nr:hypothetical protein [Granulicoccus phenolivorans]